MARRRHRKAAKKSHRRGRRRGVRRLKKVGRRSRRRLRRNPGSAALQMSLLPDTPAAASTPAAKAKRKNRRLNKRQRSFRKKLRRSAKRLRASARKMPKTGRSGLVRRARLAQAHRMTALAALAPRSPGKSPLFKAMHLKTNPGLAGLWASAKVILPQAVVGAGAMVGIAAAGKWLSDTLTTTKDPAAVAQAAATTPAAVVAAPAATVTPAAAAAGTAGLGAVRDVFMSGGKPSALVPYMPAISTTALTAVSYWAANKFAPKYKGAVALGGLLGAFVQALAATVQSKPDGLAAKAKVALLGDYTTVGGRAYAESGIFRDIGDYTTVGAMGPVAAHFAARREMVARGGGAYSTGRPRATADNATEWAANGLGGPVADHFAARRALVARGGGAYSTQRPRGGDMDNATEWATNGLDDTTEFAPGEGGVLAGGMFRGPSSR